MKRPEIISLFQKAIHLNCNDVFSDPYKKGCYVKYINDVRRLDNTFTQQTLIELVNNFSKLYLPPNTWSIPSIAYIYLAWYKECKLGRSYDFNPLEILLIPQEGKEPLINPLYKWFLEPEGMNLYLQCINGIINPVKKVGPTLSPFDLLTKGEIITKSLSSESSTNSNSDYNSNSDLNSEFSPEWNALSWSLEICWKAPSSNILN
jgi:hypothetical protein